MHCGTAGYASAEAAGHQQEGEELLQLQRVSVTKLPNWVRNRHLSSIFSLKISPLLHGHDPP